MSATPADIVHRGEVAYSGESGDIRVGVVVFRDGRVILQFDAVGARVSASAHITTRELHELVDHATYGLALRASNGAG